MGRSSRQVAMVTRESILDIGEHLFMQRGFEGVTINMIAEAIGVTRGAIYWHFETKSDLLKAIFMRARASLGGALLSIRRRRHSSSVTGTYKSIQRLCDVLLSPVSGPHVKEGHVNPLVARTEIFLNDALIARLASDALSEIHAALAETIRWQFDASRSRRGNIVLQECVETLCTLLVGCARLQSLRQLETATADHATSLTIQLAIDTLYAYSALSKRLNEHRVPRRSRAPGQLKRRHQTGQIDERVFFSDLVGGSGTGRRRRSLRPADMKETSHS
jgi:AcrR family transcriptional regulator